MISGIKQLTAQPIAKQLRFLPYALVGIGVFAFNATPDSHPYLQIYITLLEAKLGIVLVYLVSKKLEKASKAKHFVK